MTPEMAFECLIVSQDPALHCTMNEVLRNFSITMDTCPTSSKACDIIRDRNHDLVAIDWEAEDSLRLLHTIWNSPKRRKPTILAISNRSVIGTHFMLRKPVTSDSGTELLKAAYARMLLDYRLNVRCAVMVSLSADHDTGRKISITVTDIGEGGIGISSKDKLRAGDSLSFTLRLPKTQLPIHIQGRIIWTREYGTAGCDFLSIPPVHRDILRGWLKARTQVKQPLISV